jgi:hypothetical protein
MFGFEPLGANGLPGDFLSYAVIIVDGKPPW